MTRKMHLNLPRPHYDLLCSVEDIRDTVRATRAALDRIEEQLFALKDELVKWEISQ